MFKAKKKKKKERKGYNRARKRAPPYSITSSLNGLDGGSETVGGDGEVLDKVVEELPVLPAVELLGLGVPDGGVGSVSRGSHCG